MFLFNIFGFMMMFFFIIVIGIILFFVTGYQRVKRSVRGDKGAPSGRASTSTGSSYQRYYTSTAGNRGRSRSNAPAEDEVIEIPILEVTDVTDNSSK